MSIKGFRAKTNNKIMHFDPIPYILPLTNLMNYKIEYHTGTFDRNGFPIFEGDTLRSKTCEIPFKVENIVDFLMMCGAYREKNGCDIFESLEIVKEEK